MSLQDDINTFLDEQYPDISVSSVSDSKVIHFTKIGTHQFFPHEIALIDTPIFQRLRYISQLGLAYNIFPTARHSRFEHSLGVTIMIGKMWNALNENTQLDFLKGTEKADHLFMLRMAALLHDIGHGPFSHISEEVISDSVSVKSEKDRLACKPHEAIGYYIVRSRLFRDFFEDLNKNYGKNLDPIEISNLIVGKVKNPHDDQYLADMLNGQVDADKLDYIARDSDFSGVQLALGIDRLLLSLNVDDVPVYNGQTNKKLIATGKGILSMQQIVIAKVMLNCSIYNHQKLRAIDQMIVPLLRRMVERKIGFKDREIKSPLDLLKFDDFDILNMSSEDEIIHKQCKSIKLRQIFKRALVISSKTIDRSNSTDFSVKLSELEQYVEDPKDMLELNSALVETIGDGCTIYDVSLDLPITPKLGEINQKIIKDHDSFVPLKDYLHSGWLETYLANEWKGHIFSSEAYRKKAQVIGKTFLEDNFDIKFNEYAVKEAKINSQPKKKQYSLFDFAAN